VETAVVETPVVEAAVVEATVVETAVVETTVDAWTTLAVSVDSIAAGVETRVGEVVAARGTGS
jgi:hypothetical protein